MKKKTKAQREKEARAALWQRVCDIASGAAGRGVDDPYDNFFNPEDLAKLLPALEDRLDLPKIGDNRRSHLTDNPHNLNYYTDLETLVDFLFEQGVRA